MVSPTGFKVNGTGIAIGQRLRCRSFRCTYKKLDTSLRCWRCNREYDRASGQQIENFWWKSAPGASFYFMGEGKPMALRPMPQDVGADQMALQIDADQG